MEHPTWIGRTLGNRYKIERLLGQGGMSAVYKALDPNLKRVVAIKLIHEHLSTDPSFVQRFESEAAAVASLRHPNIVQVFDFNNDDGVYYMVLEFIPGETLQDRMKRLADDGGQLTPEEAIKFIINIADAMGYAHHHDMVHRDIKPANIMLDTEGQAILMDFGIVKIIGGEIHTSTGAVVGTARYMPPEIIRGEPADHRSDIYSLGVTLFEALSGRPPFMADSAMTLMMMHLNNPVPDVRDFRSGIQPEIVAVLEKCLAKEKTDRYQSAAELSADLRHVLLEAPTSQSIPLKIESASMPTKEPIVASTATMETPAKESQSSVTLEKTPVQGKTLPKGVFIGIAALVLLAAVVSLSRGGENANGEDPVQVQMEAASISETIIDTPTKKIMPSPTSTKTPEPTIIPTKSFPARIAYIVDDSDKVTSIHVADATGLNGKQLPANDCLNTDPDWYPDGAALIYQSNCNGSYDIWRMAANGSSKQVLIGDGKFEEKEASISPTGDALTYVRYLKGEDYNTNGDIRLLEFGVGDSSTGLEGRGPEYSPDGSRLAYMSFDGTAWQIFVFDFSTRKKEQITSGNVDNRWPAWSPDGQFIVYNSATGGGNTPTGIWIVPASGGESTPLITTGNYGRPSWSDTNWILFNSTDGLWIIHPDGSGMKQITEDEGRAGNWSR